MSRSFDDFRRERAEGQAQLVASDHLGVKRFLRLRHAIASVDALIAERDEVAS